MKILLSPAKTLDYESSLPTRRSTTPKFEEEAAQIARKLERMSKSELSSLMSISQKLTELNYQRYQEFSENPDTSDKRPCIYAFAGDVYDGFDAYSLDTDKLDACQDRVRVLSGLYGILRPLDAIQPYRLEMGTDLPVEQYDDLYGFWKDKITDQLLEEMDDNELLVNLASNEYFKAVNKTAFGNKVISPVFKDFKNGKLKIISFYAKKARGAMARHLVENTANDISDLYAFEWDGYAYSEEHSEAENKPMFIR